MQSKFTIKTLVYGAMIAAVYVVLTVLFKPISFGSMQCRVSELLTVLPVFTPAAIPGLFVGCLLGNILGGAVILDIVLGSLATLIAALGTYFLRNNRYLAVLSPIVVNGLIVGGYLPAVYGMEIPVWLSMVYVAVGQLISCGVGGLLLAKVIDKTPLFRN